MRDDGHGIAGCEGASDQQEEAPLLGAGAATLAGLGGSKALLAAGG